MKLGVRCCISDQFKAVDGDKVVPESFIKGGRNPKKFEAEQGWTRGTLRAG